MFTSHHNISKQKMFNTRVRCRCLLKEFKDCPECEEFKKQLNKDTQIIKEIEMDQ